MSRTGGTRRGRPAVAALLLGVLVLGAPPASAQSRQGPAASTPGPAVASTPAPGASSTARSQDPATSARVDLTGIGPTVVTPDATLTISGSITNVSATPLALVGARVRLLQSGLGTRAQVAAWYDGTDQRLGAVVGPTLDVLPRTLAPGGRAAFALAVPGPELGLDGRPFGAYGVAVEIRAQGELVRQRVGLVRSTLVWQPAGKQYAAQPVSWLVPITGLPHGGDGDAATPAQLAAAVGPGSRLRRLVDAASAPGVDWAVDPALLSRLQAIARPATPATRDSGANASDRAAIADFLADLRREAQGRVVIELPYADPDLATITRRGRSDLLRAAAAASAGIVPQVLGVAPLSTVAWPAEGWIGEAQLRVVSTVGLRNVVLDARSRRLLSPLSYTPDARAELNDGVTGWLADPVLSRVVADGTKASALPSRATVVRRVLAETAAATSERPGLARRTLIAAPRDLDPDPGAFRALVEATSTVPWIRVVPVTTLRRPAAGQADTSDLPRVATSTPSAVDQNALRPSHVTAVRRLRTRLGALGEVVDAPTTVTDEAQRSSLELLSTSWRGRPGDLRRRRERVNEQVRALTDGVHVLPSSVNFLASSGRLQVTVANELPEQVSGLRLRLTSTNPKLQVSGGDIATPTLAASTRTQVQVPVRALASGAVQLNAQLLAPSGRAVGQAVPVRVQARPTGSWALNALGAGAGVVLVVGLVRALRRPRRGQLVAP